jgi:hypothetical protein
MNKDIFQSKIFKWIILGTAGFVVLVSVFGIGVFVGGRRASFAFKWAEEYHRNFGGPQDGFFGNFIGMDREFLNANGSFGQIIKIDENEGSLTIKDVTNVEKEILTSDRTSIVFQRDNLKISELKIGDSVVVIGEPTNSGQITAELIRVMPTKPSVPSKN